MDHADWSIELFKTVYPEFTAVDDERLDLLYHRATCMYPIISPSSNICRHAFAACAVVAHLLIIEAQPGEAGQPGMAQSSGAMLSSASIDGVSVSTQSAPVGDMYDYFFGSTKYGLEFLAFLAEIGGLRYVN